MFSFRFDNAFARDLPGDSSMERRTRQVHGAAFSFVSPTPVRAPRLVAWSRDMADALGLTENDVRSPEFVQVFGGNAIVDGMTPFAMNYGGHQFGQWAGQLGDGRAISLGEVIAADGRRWELQLKGAGRTPYSRSADGRAVLRSSIREFLCSEAMHHLGVPTTRALSLVATGELVVRDMFYDGRPQHEPGAIVCRVAPSFVRFGTFELPAARKDLALLEALIVFTIRHDFPHLVASGENPASPEVIAEWFGEVAERTGRLIADWMRVGFVHGVMNTDNMSILGLTIDYGPYGWIDNFDEEWTPNTTDAGGRRYRFGQQADIAYWNLGQLAVALTPLLSEDVLHAGMKRYVDEYTRTTRLHIAGKLGLRECEDDDVDLHLSLQALLQAAEVDMTICYRRLADVDLGEPSLDPLRAAFYDDVKMREIEPAFLAWLRRYATRAKRDGWAAHERRERMNRVNPRYVLRNYLAQQAIDRAEQGDDTGVNELLDVIAHPYDDQPDAERFEQRRPEWARHRAGCSMLSCSS